MIVKYQLKVCLTPARQRAINSRMCAVCIKHFETSLFLEFSVTAGMHCLFVHQLAASNSLMLWSTVSRQLRHYCHSKMNQKQHWVSPRAYQLCAWEKRIKCALLSRTE
jgi:hypothetical protein